VLRLGYLLIHVKLKNLSSESSELLIWIEVCFSFFKQSSFFFSFAFSFSCLSSSFFLFCFELLFVLLYFFLWRFFLVFLLCTWFWFLILLFFLNRCFKSFSKFLVSFLLLELKIIKCFIGQLLLRIIILFHRLNFILNRLLFSQNFFFGKLIKYLCIKKSKLRMISDWNQSNLFSLHFHNQWSYHQTRQLKRRRCNFKHIFFIR